MDFVSQLMTKSTAELSNLEWAGGVVQPSAMGITVAFVFCRLLDKAIEEGYRCDVEDWYKNRGWEDRSDLEG